MLLNISILLLATLAPQQAITDATGHVRQLTVTESIAVDAATISEAVRLFAEAEDSGLRAYTSKDESILVYTDFSKREGKNFMKAVDTLTARMEASFGKLPEQPKTEAVLQELRQDFDLPPSSKQLVAFLLVDPAHYQGLLDTISAAAPEQRDFMQRSKDTTGFTIFAPELTCYFHDMNVQEEALPDRSIAHNLAHLELNRRYGVLPLWVREGIATAIEDMCWGEVYGPWYLHGFVFTSSHSDWRGKKTRKMVAALEDDVDILYSYSANPYQDDLAHLDFAFATYAMSEEPESFQAFLKALQDLYTVENTKGGLPAFTPQQYDELFDQAFEEGFLERMQTWWKKPPRWNAKPKKKR